MNTKSCFAPAHILLPSEQIPLEKWGCIACDQFTSDRDYWQKAEAAAAGSPSTLNMILPEVYLEDGDADARIEKIHATMDDYARNVLTRAVDGFVYVERTEQSGLLNEKTCWNPDFRRRLSGSERHHPRRSKSTVCPHGR